MTGVEKKNCDVCGDEFKKRHRDSASQWADRKYCCSKCYFKSKSFVPLHVRFWNYVERGAIDDCWAWSSNKDKHGYGSLSNTHGGTPIKAHRLSWELHNGEIPEGMVVRHKCDNPNCVNPNHLEIGTQKQNMQDASARGRLNARSLLNLRPGELGFHGAGSKSNLEILNERS